MNILFYDPVCSKPYTLNTLAIEGLGGSEASVLRVASALARAGNCVQICQKGREEPILDTVIHYSPLDHYEPVGGSPIPDVVVCLRHPSFVTLLREAFPEAQLYLWLHDIVDPNTIKEFNGALVDTKTLVVCVSDWHRTDTMTRGGLTPQVSSHTVYNIVDTDGIVRVVDNPDKLVYFGSPHKGLGTTVQVFQALKEKYPELVLYIANPGYYTKELPDMPSIVNLGILTHTEVLKHVAEAYCVLHINAGSPETFGLVLAESNALGTPVITYPWGAATEVLRHIGQVVASPEAAVEKFIEWRTYGRPRPLAPAKEFSEKSVIRQWLRLFSAH